MHHIITKASMKKHNLTVALDNLMLVEVTAKGPQILKQQETKCTMTGLKTKQLN